MTDSVTPSVQEQQFLNALQQSLEDKSFERLILSQYRGDLAQLEKISCRLVNIQDVPMLSCLYRYKTQDVTKNYGLTEANIQIQQLLNDCKQANLMTNNAEWQLKKNKKKDMLTEHKHKNINADAKVSQQHDRTKHRYVDQTRYYLQPLGITDVKSQLIPSMARKWKQINKFVEICAGALSQIEMPEKMNIVDFGSGKGYLTFALYDYLNTQGHNAFVTGVELNEQMVKFCQDVAKKSAFKQLDFFQGDVRTYEPESLEMMIALHACDVATDFAIHTGIRLNAKIIMCAPCCHKELRPQMDSPKVLKPMLQFGIHAGQQAEMLTDTIRALLLKAYGYETKVFEFVALEHTSKNKMILAIKRKDFSEPDATVLSQIAELKQMYGIQKQSLELLLNNQWDQRDIGEKC